MGRPGRNQPCPCGSGKKFKNCHLNQKPLSYSAGIELETPKSVKGVRISPDGKVQFEFSDQSARPKSAWVSVSREREKGPKTLINIPVNPTSLKIQADAALLEYDFIFAIDTNTRLIRERAVSVSHVVQLRLRQESNLLAGNYSSLGGFEFHDVTDKQENLGWFALQAAIFESTEYASEFRYAIITDSDLGNLHDYNSRKKPFYRNAYLHPNFRLIYSSEEGRGIANELIRYCDKTSSQTLAAIEAGEHPIETALEVANQPFTHFRGWYNTNPEFAKDGWFNIPRIIPQCNS